MCVSLDLEIILATIWSMIDKICEKWKMQTFTIFSRIL